MKLSIFVMIFLVVTGVTPARAAQSVFERTRTAEAINCGYAEWTPVLYKNLETGEMQGLAKDIMDAVAKKTGYAVAWSENAGWGTMAEGLAMGRYDMICVVMGAITARAKAVDFTRPIFYLPIYPVVRNDDTRFDKDLSLLGKADIKIGVLEGEASALIAAERFPKATTVAIPQTADYSLLMEDIKAKKSDISFITADTFDSFNKKHPGVFKVAQRGKPLSVAAGSFGLPPGDTRFKTLIDTALQELENEGTLNIIMDKYDPERSIFLRPSTPYILPKK